MSYITSTKKLSAAQSAYQYPLLIKSLLLSAQSRKSTKEIIYRDQFNMSYPTFFERVHRLANVLINSGVKPGDTIAVLDWDSHRYLECFYAIPMIGAVLHMVNVRLSPEQILYTMNHAEDKVVLIHNDFLPLIEPLDDQLYSVDRYIQLSDKPDENTETSLPSMGDYETLLFEAESHYDFSDFDEDSVATTFYTTGTTGDPKGVFFTHKQLVLHTLNEMAMLGCYGESGLLRENDVYMPATPMFHVHAWGVPYVATMLGIKQVYPGKYEPELMVQLQQNEGVTFSHCVPTVLQLLLSSKAAQNINFNGWKLLTGGAAPTLNLVRQAAEKGIEISTGYGMSETCPLLTITRLSEAECSLSLLDQSEARIRTGCPVNMVNLKIIDSEGEVVSHDGESVGEVVVRAPWLTQNYYRDSQKGEELWQGEWLHTGDVASISEGGIVQIKDRIKDVIKTGGEWVSSLDLENLISTHPNINTVAVVGVPDEQWDERPCAMVVLSDDSDNFSVNVLKNHLHQYVLSGQINKWAIPSRIVVVEEIPKTSVGKIDKKLIRSQLIN